MKRSTNIDCSALSYNLSLKNVDKSNTTVCEKQYFTFDDDSPKKKLTTHDNQREDIINEIKEVLKIRNDVQIPVMYFKDIYLHLKKKQYQFSTSINTIFKDHFIKPKKTSHLIDYQVCWKKTIAYMYEVNLTLQHLKSFYMSVYLFGKLNEMSYSQNGSKTIKMEQFNANLLVSLNLAGKLCQIYPYNLNDIIQLTQTYIPLEKIIQKQCQLLLIIDWKLIPVSEFEYFGLYHILCNVNKHEQMYAHKLMSISLRNVQLLSIQPSTKAVAVIITLKQIIPNSKITSFFDKLIILNSISRSQLYKTIVEYKLILKQIIKQQHIENKKTYS